MRRSRLFFAAALAAALVSWAGGATGQELKVGLSSEPTAMDPHFHNLSPNNSLTKHMFDRLVDQDENQLQKPGLALSWKTLDDTTWEFKLRPNVKFSDGSDFTANDAIYTMCRAPRVENSPSSYGIHTRPIAGMSAPDPLTLIIKTSEPGVEVSWQVTGIRQDAFARQHPVVVQEEKAVADRGRYLHPEAFGKPALLAIGPGLAQVAAN